ncbi:hypothetical protein GGR54DRAFT_637116 [Hypoxylon sp. NC1633]|nr:hypothetical protein GGR54DRAFT_637116 [Hypoxylon sp. NC1633]
MAKEGGDLSQMAKDGTRSNPGKQNTIPSVPNPHQKQDAVGDIGGTSLHSAADNPVGVGKNADDNAVTATRHAVPQSTTEKYSHSGGKEREPGSV